MNAQRERRFIDSGGKELKNAVYIDPATGVEAIPVVGMVPRPVYIPVPVPIQSSPVSSQQSQY